MSPRLTQDFDKDRLAAKFTSPLLPIPRVDELGVAFNGFYAISERAFGEPLDALDEGQMRGILPALFNTLDAARLVDLSGSTGYGGWGADGSAPHSSWRAALLDIANDRSTDRVHGWRECLSRSSIGSDPFDEALSHLAALIVTCPEERHLVHSDLLNYNVLVSGDRVTAVLDWGESKYGDFLYDVAWFSFWAPWYPAWQGIDFRKEAEQHYAAIGLDVPHLDERLRCYEVHIGLDNQQYSAFKGRWEQLVQVARRTLELAKA